VGTRTLVAAFHFLLKKKTKADRAVAKDFLPNCRKDETLMDANEQPMNIDDDGIKLIQFSRFISANSTDLNIQMKVFSDDAETFDFLVDPRPHPNCRQEK
jgi:hypothetical protein